MPNVQQILRHKGSHLHTVGSTANVLDAALLMNEHQIGALVVSDGEELTGIITERDVLRRVVAKRLDPADVAVNQIMTRQVVCCSPDTSIDQARSLLMHRRIRHLPVVDAGSRVIGLVSIGDLNAWQLTGQERELHYLHEYIHGRM